MASDGRVVFEIEGDNKKVLSTVKETTSAIQQESRKWDNAVEQSTDSMTAAFNKALDINRIKNFAIQMGKEIAKFGKEAIAAASDLAEVQNVVDVTFGDSANVIQKWADNAGRQFGLTETQAKRFTSTLGAMFKSSGIQGNEIVQMSTDLAGLAADMASFYNLDFETAFQKIRSGISGETEPLKQLGINMSVANLEAFALSQGITKAFNSMSQGEQTLLRYQYLMQATADAQGDFSRTSDGFANASRRVETALETIKTKAGETLMQYVEPLTAGLAGLMEKITEKPDSTILDTFNEIDDQTAEKFQQIEGKTETIRRYIEILSELFGGGDQGLEIANQVGELGVTSKQAEDYLRGLGYSSSQIETIQKRWLAVCKELVGTIPGLSDVIDTETGTLEGGIGAVNDYVDAWANGQKRIAALQALYAKEAAMRQEYADVPILWSHAEYLKKQLDAAEAQWKSWGVNVQNPNDRSMRATAPTGKTYAEEYAYLTQLRKDTEAAIATYEKRNGALEEAVDIFKREEESLMDATEEEKAAATATQEMNDALAEQKQAVAEAAEAFEKASEELEKYYAKELESTLSTLEKSAAGFEKAMTPADKTRDKIKDLKKELEEAEDKSKIEIKIEGYADEIPTAHKMIEGLRSQLEFFQEYADGIENLKKRGLSDTVVAALSDGSAESLDYIRALSLGTDKDIAEVNRLYSDMEQQKESLGQSLTDNRMKVDTEYQGILDTVKSSADVIASAGDDAAAAAGNAVGGIANAIALKTISVAAAVAGLNAALSSMGSFSFSSGGWFGMFNLDGSNEKGLDYVPFDGYLSELHEGEGILTAEENRIWQRFKRGGASIGNEMDYDALGGVMRENVKAGGNVYLDGRRVGAVISDIQGQNYKTMKKSGWQA